MKKHNALHILIPLAFAVILLSILPSCTSEITEKDSPSIKTETTGLPGDENLLLGLRSIDPDLFRTAQETTERVEWRHIFKALYSGYIKLAETSAPAAGFTSRIFDGIQGNLTTGFPANFLLFHGRKAKIIIEIPPFRDPFQSLSFRLIEFSDEKVISPSLVFHDCKNDKKIIPLSGEILEKKGTVNLTEYSAQWNDQDMRCGYFALTASSQSPETIFMDEIVMDRIGEMRKPIIEHCPLNLEEWKEVYGENEFQRIKTELKGRKTVPPVEMFNILLGKPKYDFQSRLIHLNKLEIPKLNSTLYSFLLQADNTGNHFIDLVRGWLLVPQNATKPLPIVVVNHHGDFFRSRGPLGLIGEDEFAVASELATNNVAVLIVDGYVNSGLGSCNAMVVQYHPNWSSQGKNHDNTVRGLDFILGASFTEKTRLTFDSTRIASWGYSYGAWFSLIAGLLDARYTDVLISHFDYLSVHILKGYSQHMSSPQISYFENDDTPPLRVPEILTSYGEKNVLVTAGDANVFKEYTSKITDKHPNVKVIINPYNHYITFGERKVVMDFIFNRFDIQAKNRISRPIHEMPTKLEDHKKFITWENGWRTKVLDGFRKTTKDQNLQTD